MQNSTIAIIACVIIIILCLSFALFAGFVKASIDGSNYKTSCTGTQTITDLDTASSRVNWVYGVTITVGVLALIGIIISLIFKFRTPSTTAKK